jgi:hypothetical protein
MKCKIWQNLNTFKKFIFIKKGLNTNNVIHWDKFWIFLKICYKKNPSKTISYEKIKILKNGSFVVESFVTIVSFDYDCIQF